MSLDEILNYNEDIDYKCKLFKTNSKNENH